MKTDPTPDSRYEILGKAGTTWLATERTTGARVLLRPTCTVIDPTVADQLAVIRHNGLPRMIDRAPLSDGSPAYVFEFLEGISLSEIAKQAGGVLTPGELLPVIARAARVLGFLHRQGESSILHLDIKPDHILVKEDGTVCLIDFGASRLLLPDAEDDIDHPIAATPDYAAPEQVAGRPCAGSDVYALGLVMLHLLTGQPLSACRTMPPSTVLANHSDALQHLACRSLQSDPGQRFCHADEMASAIEALLTGDPEESIDREPLPNASHQVTTLSDAVQNCPMATDPGNISTMATVICIWGNAAFGCELAAVLAEKEPTLVIDADLMNPRADLLLGIQRRDRKNAIRGFEGGLDLALAEESRGHLDIQALNRLIRSSRVPGVSLLSTTSGMTQYDSHQLSSFKRVIHLAQVISRIVVVLCSQFVFDGFTCLSLQVADHILIPVTADIGAFRERRLAIDYQVAQFSFDSGKLRFAAYPYDPAYDLSRGTLDELSEGSFLGCISDSASRRRRKCGAKPYAAALERGNRREYRDLIRRLHMSKRTRR